MNIPGFATTLAAIIRRNVEIARNGGSPRDYLVPMAWGDPGLGKTEIVEAVAKDLTGTGFDLVDGGLAFSWEVMHADLQTRDPAELGGMPGSSMDAPSAAGRIGCRPAASGSSSSTSCRRPASPT